jgi:DNA repair protein RadA/Sms
MPSKVSYLCEACGYVAPSYLGRCPECQAWNSFSEQVSIKVNKSNNGPQRSRSGSLMGTAPLKETRFTSQPTYSHRETPVETGLQDLSSLFPETSRPLHRLSTVEMEEVPLCSSGFSELDRVLGGGILPGSYVLIGGDPGIGKSTLMLQMASAFASQFSSSPNASHSKNADVLYVAGEESAYQVRLRAERLQVQTELIDVLTSTDIQQIAEVIRQTRPPLVIIDSIQSMYCQEVSGTPGSVTQIRECAAILMEVAKSFNVAIFLIGHVTKEGAVAGPKVLEHTVDAVLYFEGDKYQHLRILRAVKNRFGNTQEIGVFEMVESGLREIDNPSALFLGNASLFGSASIQAGSVIAATLEGSRPLLVEIQALVGQSTYPSPRRTSNGIDTNRVHQIVAVLERRLGLDFSKQDIYVNVVGGLRIDEPAADLAVAIAIISSARDIPVIAETVVTGEIGLTGEIRSINQIERREKEASRIGFTRMVCPASIDPTLKNATNSTSNDDIERFSVQTLADAVKACFTPKAEL